MLQQREIGPKLSKKELGVIEPGLRVDLLNCQFDLGGRRDASLVVLLTGDDRIGCDAVYDRLHEWLDARRIDAAVLPGAPTEGERQYPPFWRYWQVLPPKGRMGLVFGGWAAEPLVGRLRGELGKRAFERRIEHVRALERALVADGTALCKLWIHLPPDEHEKRLRKARRKPEKEWRVEDADFRLFERLDQALPLVERFLGRTDSAHAPWLVIDGSDARRRDVTAAQAVLEALRRRLARTGPPDELADGRGELTRDFQRGALNSVDLGAELEPEDYERRLEQAQGRLSRLSRRARKHGLASVLVFEGWDAAGKGGAIRRITAAMSARDVKVLSVAAPTEEEQRRHYLWRFWRRLPRAGRMAIFDRSWYGRVLVERVEGFATPDEWRRAYGEIEDFESQLVEHGLPLCKFWLHIDPDEQERRFLEREQTPYKKYKLTAEDRRNRAKWDQYVEAVDEMIHRTSSAAAPWTLVPANDKRLARVLVLEEVCRRLEERLG